MKMNTREPGISPAALAALARGDVKNFLVASSPGGIEAQEKAGQMEQARLQTLPFNLAHHGDQIAARKPWEALGFKFGKKVDDIFVECTFPKGWTKKPTDHDMWTEILDEQGRKRGMIFYKAAFYDRSAHAHLERRFCVTGGYDNPPVVYVKDACGKTDFKVTGLDKPDWRGDRAEAEKRQAKIDEAVALAETFLKNNYPDYENPTAYWS